MRFRKFCTSSDYRSTHPVEETSSFPKYPTPFSKFNFTLLQCFVAVVERGYPLLKSLRPIGELIDFGSGRSCHCVVEFVDGTHRYFRLLHLRLKVSLWYISPVFLNHNEDRTQLSLHIIESSYFLRKCSLERSGFGVQLRRTSELVFESSETEHRVPLWFDSSLSLKIAYRATLRGSISL